jgi:hypothetical protein
MTTRKDLEDLTKAEIIEMYDLDMDPLKTTKDNLVDLALRAEHKKARTVTPRPADDGAQNWLGDLTDALAACTLTFTDPAGVVHVFNPDQAHTINFSGFPEAVGPKVLDEWGDFMATLTVTLDDAVIATGRLLHPVERRQGRG